jgi:hypothetical protein
VTTWEHHTLPCPRCGAELAARLATGVHVARLPAIRDDILARRFHRAACAACGATTEIRRPFVYTDFGRRHWILAATADDLARWPAWEARLRRDVSHAFDHGSPLAHGLADQLQARVVFGHDELREKLVVWDAGLDDALVECLKLRALASDPSLAAPASRLLVDRAAPDDTLELTWFAHAADPIPARRFATPPGWLRDTDRDRASLAARFPELFAGGFVSVARLLHPANPDPATPDPAKPHPATPHPATPTR